jgi:hypothetical protein
VRDLPVRAALTDHHAERVADLRAVVEHAAPLERIHERAAE